MSVLLQVDFPFTGPWGDEMTAAMRGLAESIASGDLTPELTVRAGDEHSLMAAMQKMQLSLRQMVALLEFVNTDPNKIAAEAEAQAKEEGKSGVVESITPVSGE